MKTDTDQLAELLLAYYNLSHEMAKLHEETGKMLRKLYGGHVMDCLKTPASKLKE